MKLTPKQKKFCDEYLIDLNATQAAIRAGYKKDYADRMAYKLVENSRVKEYIQECMKEREKRTETKQDRAINEIAKIAFANITDYVQIKNNEVKIIETEKLTNDQKAAIINIKQGANGIEIKMADKIKALELLGRHLGMFKEKFELTGKDEGAIKFDFSALSKEEILELTRLVFKNKDTTH